MEAEIWGRRIRAYRKLKGYTQEGFAKALGISVSVLGEVERGNRMPSESMLRDSLKLGINLQQRDEHKQTFMHSRMRNDKLLCLNIFTIIQQNVKVCSPRPPSNVAFAAEFFFNTLSQIEQFRLQLLKHLFHRLNCSI